MSSAPLFIASSSGKGFTPMKLYPLAKTATLLFVCDSKEKNKTNYILGCDYTIHIFQIYYVSRILSYQYVQDFVHYYHYLDDR